MNATIKKVFRLIFIGMGLVIGAIFFVLLFLFISWGLDGKSKESCFEGRFSKRCSYKPTQEQIRNYETARKEILDLFDALPQLKETELKLLPSSEEYPRYNGRHEALIWGLYQAGDAHFEAKAFSNLSTEEICRAYLSVFIKDPSTWEVVTPYVGYEVLNQDKDYCLRRVREDKIPSSTTIRTTHSLRFYDRNARNKGGYFMFEFSAESFQSSMRPDFSTYRTPDGRTWQTKIEISMIYQNSTSAGAWCYPQRPDDYPCDQSFWRENGVR